MAGDYSRETHDPRKRFASVLMQQGRVQLDADWNEQAAILRERLRIQARETFGRAAASRFGTGDAFRIGVITGPPRDLSIQPGRYWVDGRLAEAFATDGNPITYLRQPFLPAPPTLPAQGGAIVYLETWEREVTWVEDPSLLDVALGGVDTAARLQSVWQVRVQGRANASCGLDLDAIFPPSPARLTTSAVAPPAPDDPCLIAPRVGYRGLENRLYRVEVHVGGNAATARFKYSRDNASVRSPVLSMRRETRGTRDVTVLSVARIGRDPGLRINAGDWVEVTDEHRLLLGESGEMAQVAEPPLEQPGEDGVQVVLDRLIPGAGGRAFGADAAQLAARRTRIIRWDQAAPRNALDANGLMTVGTAAVALEEGIEARFALSGGNQFRAGDWWNFAARTADASVEVLNAAPPEGPIRRYAMLASFAEIGRGDAPSDCRTIWPPVAQGGEGCCTMIVRPGENVQAAIDRLPPEGGCVCLKPGLHELREPLRIRAGRISLHAESPGSAVLRRAGQVPILVVGGGGENRLPVTDVHIAGLVLQLGSLDDRRAAADGLLSILPDARRVTVEHCRFSVQDFAGQTAAARIAGAEVALRHCAVERMPFGIATADSARDLEISDCAFLGADEGAEEDAGAIAIWAPACDGALRIERNAISFYRQGVVLGDDPLGGGRPLRADPAVVVGNLVTRTTPRAEPEPPAPPPPTTVPGGIGGIREGLVRETFAANVPRVNLNETMRTLATNRAPGMATLAPAAERFSSRAAVAVVDTGARILFGIIAAARNATVTENVLSWSAAAYGGILAGIGTRLVAGNDLAFRGRAVIRDDTVGEGAQDEPPLALGILLGLGEARGASGCVVEGNLALGRLVGVVVGRTEEVVVRGNLLAQSAAGVLVSGAEGTRIEGNTLHSTETGMLVAESSCPVIEGNSIIASRNEGILLISTGRNAPLGAARIRGNTLLNCGHEEENASAITATALDPEAAAGIATASGAEIVLEHNLVAETGVPPSGGERASRAQAVALAAPRVTVHGNDIRWDMPVQNDPGMQLLAREGAKPNRALLVLPVPATGFVQGQDGAFASACSVTDNRIRGYAADALVELRDTPAGDNQRGARFLALNVTGNLVEHWGPLDTPGVQLASVILRADSRATVAVSGNVVRGPGRRPSVLIEGPRQAAYAGNATTGPQVGAAVAVNVLV